MNLSGYPLQGRHCNNKTKISSTPLSLFFTITMFMILSFFLITTSFFPSGSLADKHNFVDDGYVTIIATSSTRGKILPLSRTAGYADENCYGSSFLDSKCHGGCAKRVGFVHHLRNNFFPDALVVDNGSYYFSHVVMTLFGTAPFEYCALQTGYDVIAVGGSDLYQGLDLAYNFFNTIGRQRSPTDPNDQQFYSLKSKQTFKTLNNINTTDTTYLGHGLTLQTIAFHNTFAYLHAISQHGETPVEHVDLQQQQQQQQYQQYNDNNKDGNNINQVLEENNELFHKITNTYNNMSIYKAELRRELRQRYAERNKSINSQQTSPKNAPFNFQTYIDEMLLKIEQQKAELKQEQQQQQQQPQYKPQQQDDDDDDDDEDTDDQRGYDHSLDRWNKQGQIISTNLRTDRNLQWNSLIRPSAVIDLPLRADDQGEPQKVAFLSLMPEWYAASISNAPEWFEIGGGYSSVNYVRAEVSRLRSLYGKKLEAIVLLVQEDRDSSNVQELLMVENINVYIAPSSVEGGTTARTYTQRNIYGKQVVISTFLGDQTLNVLRFKVNHQTGDTLLYFDPNDPTTDGYNDKDYTLFGELSLTPELMSTYNILPPLLHKIMKTVYNPNQDAVSKYNLAELISENIFGLSGTDITPEAWGCRAATCPMGRLAATAMLNVCNNYRPPNKENGNKQEKVNNCTMAFLNSGSIRDSFQVNRYNYTYPNGTTVEIVDRDITLSHVFSTFPFFNKLMSFDLKGSVILQLLAHSMSYGFSAKLLQTNLRWVVYPYERRETAAPLDDALNRIMDVNIPILNNNNQNGGGNDNNQNSNLLWEPIQKDKIYRVITLSYLLEGKDGFDRILNESSVALNNMVYHSDTLLTSVLTYLKSTRALSGPSRDDMTQCLFDIPLPFSDQTPSTCLMSLTNKTSTNYYQCPTNQTICDLFKNPYDDGDSDDDDDGGDGGGGDDKKRFNMLSSSNDKDIIKEDDSDNLIFYIAEQEEENIQQQMDDENNVLNENDIGVENKLMLLSNIIKTYITPMLTDITTILFGYNQQQDMHTHDDLPHLRFYQQQQDDDEINQNIKQQQQQRIITKYKINKKMYTTLMKTMKMSDINYFYKEYMLTNNNEQEIEENEQEQQEISFYSQIPIQDQINNKKIQQVILEDNIKRSKDNSNNWYNPYKRYKTLNTQWSDELFENGELYYSDDYQITIEEYIDKSEQSPYIKYQPQHEIMNIVDNNNNNNNNEKNKKIKNLKTNYNHQLINTKTISLHEFISNYIHTTTNANNNNNNDNNNNKKNNENLKRITYKILNSLSSSSQQQNHQEQFSTTTSLLKATPYKESPLYGLYPGLAYDPELPPTNSDECGSCSGFGVCSDQHICRCTLQDDKSKQFTLINGHPTHGLYQQLTMISGPQCGTILQRYKRSTSVALTIYTAAWSVILFSLLSLLFIIYYRNHPIIKSTSVDLSIIMCCGGILAGIGIHLFIYIPISELQRTFIQKLIKDGMLKTGWMSRLRLLFSAVTFCNTSLWIVLIGFMMIFGSLTARLHRIHSIFNAKTLIEISKVTAFRTRLIFSLFLGIEILLLLLIRVIIPLRPTAFAIDGTHFFIECSVPFDMKSSSSSSSSTSSSTSDYYDINNMEEPTYHGQIWSARLLLYVFLVLYNAGVLIYAAYLSISTRKVDHRFNESSTTGLSIYNAVLVSILFFLTMLAGYSNPGLSKVFQSLVLAYGVLSTLLLILCPKIYIIYNEWVKQNNQQKQQRQHQLAMQANAENNNNNNNGNLQHSMSFSASSSSSVSNSGAYTAFNDDGSTTTTTTSSLLSSVSNSGSTTNNSNNNKTYLSYDPIMIKKQLLASEQQQQGLEKLEMQINKQQEDLMTLISYILTNETINPKEDLNHNNNHNHNNNNNMTPSSSPHPHIGGGSALDVVNEDECYDLDNNNNGNQQQQIKTKTTPTAGGGLLLDNGLILPKKNKNLSLQEMHKIQGIIKQYRGKVQVAQQVGGSSSNNNNKQTNKNNKKNNSNNNNNNNNSNDNPFVNGNLGGDTTAYSLFNDDNDQINSSSSKSIFNASPTNTMAMPNQNNNNNNNNTDKVECHHDGTQTVVKPNGYSYTRRSIFAGSSLGAGGKRAGGMSYSSSTASLIPTNTNSGGGGNGAIPGMISNNNNSTTDNNNNNDQKR